MAAVAVGLLVIAGRLIQLQGLDGGTYAKMAEQQRMRTVTLTAPRGTITDRDGYPLAITVDARDIYADPREVVDPAAAAAALAPILGMSQGDLVGKLSTKDTPFVYLQRGVTPQVGTKVMALGLAGLGTLPTTKRSYPDGALAANVLGFVGTDGTGLGGLEYTFDKKLSGTNGKRTFETGRDGEPIPDGQHVDQPPVAGESLRLTLDRDIQWQAQQAISAQVQKTGAMSGTVIVMQPKTGRVLALATAPTFDPNHPGNAAPQALGDPAVSDPYEPGSVNKVITMAAALQRGLVTPTTPFVVPNTYTVANHVFHDAENHGTEHLTTAGILAQSSNIGTIQVAQRLGEQNLYDALRNFGFGATTGIGLPGESAGILPPVDKWWATTLPTVAFGQGVSVTALQVASVYSTIANNGVRMEPTIIDGTTDPAGHFTARPLPKPVQVVSPQTAQEVRDMLEAVTSDQGTAPAARIAGYRVAGKTGTANRADGHGGYSGYTSSFVGFAPADDPQLVVEVVLQKPVNGHFGGEVAAPVFHDVMAFALQSLRIPPTGTTPPTAKLTW